LNKTVALFILDGFGIGNGDCGNAVMKAKMPNYKRYMEKYPHTDIGASGMEVGLPEGQMGNSEVGHLNIGAGRIVYQELTRITKEIKEGAFFENKALIEAIESAKKKGGKVHLMGLLSDGGVHSHIDHLKGLLKLCRDKGMQEAYVHAFLDGRDTPPQSALGYIDELEEYMKRIGTGKIATVSGRYYAMDRDNRWERVQKAYEVLASGAGETAKSAREAVENSYAQSKHDEFILPTAVQEDGKPVAKIEDGDSIIFFNFRPDRARELTRTFVDEDFTGFERIKPEVFFVCMTQYDATIKGVKVAYEPQSLSNTLGEYLSSNGKSQLRMAETEKYAHVTFFFNGGKEEPYKGEDRKLVPSPKVATYDMQPEMSAFEVAGEFEKMMDSKDYDFAVLNFANPDMVGHTGNMGAVIKALEAVDKCLGIVVEKVISKGGTAIITADHGNSEYMVDEQTGQPFTAHTTNRVPLIMACDQKKSLRSGGRLCDIAPTVLDLLGMEKPDEMTGISLIEKN